MVKQTQYQKQGSKNQKDRASLSGLFFINTTSQKGR